MARNALQSILDRPTRNLFFTGKGGVGKTSLSCAVAVSLADHGSKVLLVSTDPASNLSEVLGTALASSPRPVPGVKRLFAVDIDPMAAAEAYRQRVVGPYRGVLPDEVVAGIEEQLSGSCTVEIAAFDQFTGLLADPGDYDHIVFDTAPTGHTLRMLALPGAWTGYLDTNTVGGTCVGPLSGLTQQRALYREALAVLSDRECTTLVLVTRPDAGAVAEAGRASAELATTGLRNQHLVINGVFPGIPTEDPIATALARRQREVLLGLPSQLLNLPTDFVSLTDTAPLGVHGLRALLHPRTTGNALPSPARVPLATEQRFELSELLDRVARRRSGLIMTVGKGGVGKTTMAAAIAVAVARKGVPVTLSTTDPAAHLSLALNGDGDLPATLVVERVDPASATEDYTREVLATAGAGLEGSARDVLVEDLRSPCTEEIAVFRTFAATVAKARDRVVVLDTAPSGHTLLLLDTAHSFQREVNRQSAEVPPEVGALLDRLTDADFTTILVVTLAEPTPVHEASALHEDLLRAGIRPSAWVVNQSLLATGTNDPLLATLARHEERWIEEAMQQGGRVALVAWQPEPPVGPRALEAMIRPCADRVLAASAS